MRYLKGGNGYEDVNEDYVLHQPLLGSHLPATGLYWAVLYCTGQYWTVLGWVQLVQVVQVFPVFQVFKAVQMGQVVQVIKVVRVIQ